MRWSKCAAVILAALVAGSAPAHAQKSAVPSVPCTGDIAPIPDYAEPGAPPAVAIWRDVAFAPVPCLKILPAVRPELVVALAGRFVADAPLEALAARIGAISKTNGLVYWSATDGNWRRLIETAHAVTGPDGETPRDDFSAAEVMSGKTLYFMQDDTRSTTENVYAMAGRRLGTGGFTVEIVNVTAIRVFVVTMFAPRSLAAAHIFQRIENRDGGRAVWSYYGLTTSADVPLGGQEKSFVNRAGAYYRFFAGRPGDDGPPLAR